MKTKRKTTRKVKSKIVPEITFDKDIPIPFGRVRMRQSISSDVIDAIFNLKNKGESVFIAISKDEPNVIYNWIRTTKLKSTDLAKKRLLVRTLVVADRKEHYVTTGNGNAENAAKKWLVKTKLVKSVNTIKVLGTRIWIL